MLSHSFKLVQDFVHPQWEVGNRRLVLELKGKTQEKSAPLPQTTFLGLSTP